MPNTGKHVARSCHTAEKGTWAAESDLPPSSYENLDESPTFPKPVLGLIKEGRIFCALFRHRKNCKRKEGKHFLPNRH